MLLSKFVHNMLCIKNCCGQILFPTCSQLFCYTQFFLNCLSTSIYFWCVNTQKYMPASITHDLTMVSCCKDDLISEDRMNESIPATSSTLYFKCWLSCTFYVCPHSVHKCACTVVYIVLSHLSLSYSSRCSAHVRWLDTYGCVTV